MKPPSVIRPRLCNIAHRGARSLAPENTMMAIVKAWELSAHGCETDVRITRDERLVLHHDRTFRRTTDILTKFPERCDDPVESFSLDEIQRLDAGSWFLELDPFGEIAAGAITDTDLQAMHGLKVPTLEEALDFVKERSWFINLELKRTGSPHLVGRILSALDHCGIEPQHFALSSFEHDYLRTIQCRRRDIEINALIGESEQTPQDWGNFEFAVYNANVHLTDDDQIRTALAHNCRVNLYTVNDPQWMLHFLNIGVDKIVTDYPQRLSLLLSG